MRGPALSSTRITEMGNLYGSEYWTYTLPRRVGEARARVDPVVQAHWAKAALEIGFLDDTFGEDTEAFSGN